MDYSTTYRLAQEIRDSEEYRTYHELKETVMAEETTAALIREYRKLQLTIQMSAMSGNTANQEDMQRFSGISTLLFAKPEVSQFLLSEMRLQQALADIFKILTEAADVEMAVPVDATPKVVATPIATVGPIVTTATPTPAPAAPAPAFLTAASL